MYTSLDIANEFMKLAKQEGYPIQPMKLLKLTYIAHGWYLGFNGKPLISDTVQAWKYGPVIPILYGIIKRFGSGNVDPMTIELYKEKELSKTDAEFVKLIWNNYKKYSGLELSSKTHMPNTPWSIVFDGEHNKPIPNELIENYYKEIINERRPAK
ncbi:type II toxin-antitoxin system antitoxin SocA domain-containing protein [uncultured Chryseobacterium sp.]|uniref:Panacea domain-containing protein n=1 Tax=uncultured Chryseobacterium sp. TaxID=259322 RepID=UPI002588C5E3|nr:type II toxin-antitoxin system antitoxin SocA domain-containing protein [uncultured Chryseobacterium sp.]